jgi:hypothetical protein
MVSSSAALYSTPARRESVMALSRSVSERDRRILSRAHEKLPSGVVDWGDAVRALNEAVEELIPAGRCYFLGTSEDRPVVGSLVSGVGIAPGIDSIQLVVRGPCGSFTSVGRLGP